MNITLDSVSSIIESNFMEELQAYVTECVANMDDYDLQPYFDNLVESAGYEGINSINVTSCEVIEDEDEQSYSGEMVVDTEVTGFVYYDRESHSIGSAEIGLVISFVFFGCNDKYGEIELEWEE